MNGRHSTGKHLLHNLQVQFLKMLNIAIFSDDVGVKIERKVVDGVLTAQVDTD